MSQVIELSLFYLCNSFQFGCGFFFIMISVNISILHPTFSFINVFLGPLKCSIKSSKKSAFLYAVKAVLLK